ncbi:hypothetical protein [Conexibacter sp. SYSU D00693]|uniref:hypothetical protein n=1 Tax=Conexibacter sp. SYSU D00693 TaxID=2812560 RepID=UPI00196AEB20|nr:hypothetical protein [Conexibacter sp. SYSU D00693]
MSPRARIAIVAVAAVGLVLAFFAARGSDDADDPPATVAGTTTQSTPAPEVTTDEATGGTTAPAGTTETEAEPAEPEEPAVQTIRVRDGQPVGGVQEVEVDSGEQVRFRVSSDVTDHVHVHGYDLMRDVGPGKPATFSFEADAEGRFEVELEERGVQIAELRVTP